MHAKLMDDASLRAAYIDTPELIFGRDLLLNQLGELCLDVTEFGCHLAAQILVDLNDLQTDFGRMTAVGPVLDRNERT